MDPHLFLDRMFMMAGGFYLAEHIEHSCTIIPRSSLPQEGQDAFDKAQAAGDVPVAYGHPDKGFVIISSWKDEDESPNESPMRFTCWAEVGEDAWGQFTFDWWKENNPALQDR
jgi:hypothetical protein